MLPDREIITKFYKLNFFKRYFKTFFTKYKILRSGSESDLKVIFSQIQGDNSAFKCSVLMNAE